MRTIHLFPTACVLIAGLATSLSAAEPPDSPPPAQTRDSGGTDLIRRQPATFLHNGVTAHRGNSGEHPENTLPAFESGIALGVDWLELDLFRTRDGRLVVIHDRTTARVGDRDMGVPESDWKQLREVDVASDFRRRSGKSPAECPPQRIPLLEEVLQLVMAQTRTRVSLQPKLDCVEEAVALVRRMRAERWVGFNDGNLQYLADAKRLAPEIPVFWDRGPDADIDKDVAIATSHGFEALVLHHSSVTSGKVQKVAQAGLEVGAWTVNDESTMRRLLQMGVQRIYTDHPRTLLALAAVLRYGDVACEGTYPHHLQGVCVDEESIYWSFTTTLVKTDLEGRLLKKVPVANHHGDLCHHDGRLYVAVNLGKFNDPQGNADSWVYVYDTDTLEEVTRHQTPQVFHGAGGIGWRDGRFFVVGGLPEGVEENYVYEYDADLTFVKKHVLPSGHTHLGIQTATFAHDRWWFGCYGSPQILLVTNADFQMEGRYEFDCSLGIAGINGGRLLAASGACRKPHGCNGSVSIVVPDKQAGLIRADSNTGAQQ